VKVVDLPVDLLREAVWNSHQVDEAMMARLKESIKRFGLVENLVVRSIGSELYEVLSGNHRLRVLAELGYEHVPCIVVNLDDGNARLLAQALNRIHGEDDLGLRAELVRKALESISKEEIIRILPETANTLNAIAAIGEGEMAAYLKNWEKARAMKVRHLGFKLTEKQLVTVEEALSTAVVEAIAIAGENPNLRGNCLYILSLKYLERSV
jgi:ParB family chromosome partitioning protein